MIMEFRPRSRQNTILINKLILSKTRVSSPQKHPATFSIGQLLHDLVFAKSISASFHHSMKQIQGRGVSALRKAQSKYHKALWERDQDKKWKNYKRFIILFGLHYFHTEQPDCTFRSYTLLRTNSWQQKLMMVFYCTHWIDFKKEIIKYYRNLRKNIFSLYNLRLQQRSSLCIL